MFPPGRFLWQIFLGLGLSFGIAQPVRAVDDAIMKRGARLYTERCALCHQGNGEGTPGAFPPLAKSDWLKADRERAIKVLCEGLSGEITVLGKTYNGVMPAQALDDSDVAAVLTYVTNSWGEESPAFTEKEVAAARAKTRFKTYADLIRSTGFQMLPKPPAGFTIREVVKLPENCTRLAGGEKGIYVLSDSGTIYSLNLGGSMTPIIQGEDYINTSKGYPVTLGLTVDSDGRLWVTSNQEVLEGHPYYTDEVTIWRSSEVVDGHPAKMKPWFKTTYPYGVGGMNHGVGHLAFGPDGMLYVSSGARTDGGEIRGSKGSYYQGAEVDITACIWQLDPKAAKPKIEVHARGLRNPYGFAWDGEGSMFAFSNGPDYSAPEEMDLILPGRHYGFPYQYSDWPIRPRFPYEHTPPPPKGVTFTSPVMNLGPAAGGTAEGLGTFDAHSCPGGAIWCGDDFPEPLRGGFLVTRFGNMLGPPAAPKDVGFDLISVHVDKKGDARATARVETVLAPLSRPLDVLRVGPGRVLILEYARSVGSRDQSSWGAGRILELAPVER